MHRELYHAVTITGGEMVGKYPQLAIQSYPPNRVCACGTILSIYNSIDLCSLCFERLSGMEKLRYITNRKKKGA